MSLASYETNHEEDFENSATCPGENKGMRWDDSTSGCTPIGCAEMKIPPGRRHRTTSGTIPHGGDIGWYALSVTISSTSSAISKSSYCARASLILRHLVTPSQGFRYVGSPQMKSEQSPLLRNKNCDTKELSPAPISSSIRDTTLSSDENTEHTTAYSR